MRLFILLLSCALLPMGAMSRSLFPLYQRGTVQGVEKMVIPGEGERYLMVHPSMVRVGKDGSIYLLNNGQDQILLFDHTGKFIRAFSRKGSGPGEIAHCYMMELDSQGHVCTFDFANRRFSFFEGDGRFVKSVKPVGRFMPRKFRILSEGRLLIGSSTPDFESVESGSTVSLSLYDAAMENKKVVFSQKIFDNVWRRGESNQLLPFYNDVFWDIQADGTIVVAIAKEYKIEFYSPECRLLKTLSHETDKVAVSDEDKETFFAGLSFTNGKDVINGASPEVRKTTVFPKFKPSFDGMILDAEGFILLRTARQESGLVVWDVFSPDGVFVNRVRIPRDLLSFGSQLIEDRVYWLRETDDEPELVCTLLQ